MKKAEMVIATIIFVGLFIVAFTGDAYQAPQFAGSLPGGVVGTVAAFFMFFPLIYMLIKRIKPLRRSVAKVLSLRTLLTIHIYGTFLAAILVFVHSGNMMRTFYGVTLVILMLIIIGSGYVGKYLMGFLIKDIHEEQAILKGMNREYERVAKDIMKTDHPFFRVPLPEVVCAIADLDFSIYAQDHMKKLFSRWLSFHLCISMVFYAFLVLHIWTGIYFGMRWHS